MTPFSLASCPTIAAHSLQQTPYQPSGKGINGEARSLSFAPRGGRAFEDSDRLKGAGLVAGSKTPSRNPLNSASITTLFRVPLHLPAAVLGLLGRSRDQPP